MSLSISVGNSNAAARDAFMANLYAKDGLLRDTLVNIRDYPDSQHTVALLRNNDAFDRGDPYPYVGVAVILASGHAMAYVQPKFRQGGWGSKLIATARACSQVPADRLFARPGDDLRASSDFWAKSKIECRDLEEPFAMRQSEADHWYRHGQCLIFRPVEQLTLQVFEALYLERLYTDDYSDKHNGLRGHLHALISEDHSPVDYIGFHLQGKAIVTQNSGLQIRQIYNSLCIVETQLETIDGARVNTASIQLFVKPELRRQGLGQEILDMIRRRLPNHRLKGHYTPSSENLYRRNGVEDLNWKPNDHTPSTPPKTD